MQSIDQEIRRENWSDVVAETPYRDFSRTVFFEKYRGTYVMGKMDDTGKALEKNINSNIEFDTSVLQERMKPILP